jgi:hypothetical protein
MSRLDRFLRLEKQRPAEDTGPAPTLRSPGRFEAEPAAEERPLRVLRDEGMPFVRCCVCRTDSHVNSVRCPNCGDDLASPVQRAFNEALAREYARRADEDDAEVEQLRAARAEAEEEARRAQRQLETILRSTHGELPRPVTEDDPIGLRLARRITHPLLRMGVLAAVALLPFALLFSSSIGSARFEIGILLLIVVAGCFAPRSWRRRVWEDD